MSHYRKYATVFRSAESLEKTFQDLEGMGIPVVRNAMVRGYSGATTSADFGITKSALKDFTLNNYQYAGLGYCWNESEGQFVLTADNLDMEHGTKEVAGIINKRYQYHEAIRQMEAKGYRLVKSVGDELVFEPTRKAATWLKARNRGTTRAKKVVRARS